MATQPPSTPTSAGLGARQYSRKIALPEIKDDLPFVELVRSLAAYFTDIIDVHHTFEQLRTTRTGMILRPLIHSLSEDCHHHCIVAALLVVKWHFNSSDPDDRGVNETRAYACEVVAWRFLTHLSETDLIDYLLYELPTPAASHDEASAPQNDNVANRRDRLSEHSDERSRLLPGSNGVKSVAHSMHGRISREDTLLDDRAEPDGDDPTLQFVGLNALEIAAVAEAKKFLSQKVVQRIVNAIWCGDIVFWDSLTVHARKKAHKYNERTADPYSRLRVPKYQKVFEAIFFALFLVLYYAVLVERNPRTITPTEVLLYIWIAAFAYEEFGEFRDAGALFYSADFWTVWDLGIIGVGAAFLIARIIGLAKDSDHIIDVSFDILSLEALFLVPRIFALLSLQRYYGILLPCLKEMTKEFVKYLSVIVILYMGFLTTFTLLARDKFTPRQMSWILIKVFFGSSYLGFDIASEISPLLGPAVMLVFVCMTNILLITSLISLLSNSLTKVLDHAREEYLFQYSVFVLEASASRRLTYYLPPLNLLPLILFRPLRLCIPADRLRSARIILLKASHAPYVAAIWAYESLSRQVSQSDESWFDQSYGRPLRERIGAVGSSPGSSRKPRLAALTKRSEVSLGGMATLDGREQSAGASEVADLKQMMEKLSRQVEELTWRLDQDRGR